MKVVVMFVSSLDGKITQGDDPDVTKWSSKEDQELFKKVLDGSRLIVMGRKTYDAAKAKMRLKPDTLRVVLTKNPKKYRSHTVPGQLEFSDEIPRELVDRLEKKGHKEMLLVGGSELAILFYKEKLIDELWLTIEPLIIGNGIPIVGDQSPGVSFQLIDLKRLNDRGTLHLRYRAIGS